MTAILKTQWEELAQFARELAAAAGASILPLFRMSVAVQNKSGSGFDPVTDADRAAEQTMRTLIEKRYPNDGIIGEEFGERQTQSGFTWILDPIDGTRSFICGLPTWTTLIALRHEDRSILGLVSQPFVDEIFVGGPFGSWSEHRKSRQALSVKPAREMAAAILTTVSPEIYRTPFQRRVLEALQKRTRMTRYGGDAYFFAMLAAGHIDIAMDAGLETYDIAALVPIIEGAGGVVTTWEGGSAIGGGNIIAAASRDLHSRTLEIIQSVRE